MGSTQTNAGFKWNEKTWQAAEKLVSPNLSEREGALDLLSRSGVARKSPLVAYLLVSMISDPNLETRFHAVQEIGSLLTKDDKGEFCPDRVLVYVQAYFAKIGREQILGLLAIAVQYLSAEQSLIEIFKLCSYAGDILSGIVNDRKLPVSIRKMAIYFSGEVGYLDTVSSINGLINRIEKRKSNTVLRKRMREEEELYSYAVTALEKLDA